MLIQSFEMDARREGMRLGIQQGRDEGREEGFSLGSRQTKLEMASAMKHYGDSVQKIAQVTGLSMEEIEKL